MMNDDTDTLSNDIKKMDISDDELFRDAPPREECPICMLPMPYASGACGVDKFYMACCGKVICGGCINASAEEIDQGNMKDWCSFCRLPLPDSKKVQLKRIKKRLDANDHSAFHTLGCEYQNGGWGLPVDNQKALELWHRAVELGSIDAHHNIGCAYRNGHFVERDTKRAYYHDKLAAIGGNEWARFNVGITEDIHGNFDLSMKHFMVAASNGYDDALKAVGNGYKAGRVTKEAYANTLRAYQRSRDAMKSEQRTKAFARDGSLTCSYNF